jgi:hypothetical protein
MSPKINDYCYFPWEVLRDLPGDRQVDLRLQKMAERPGHRGFIHTLRRRIQELPEETRDHFCRGGWRLEDEN